MLCEPAKIEKLLNYPIVGNHDSDEPLFDYAHEIIIDPTQPLWHRWLALWCIDRAMGVQGELDLTSDHDCMIALEDYLGGFYTHDEVQVLLNRQ